jgi:hypothetical protein
MCLMKERAVSQTERHTQWAKKFADETLEPHPIGCLSYDEVHARYLEWCGETLAWWSRTTLVRALHRAGFHSTRVRGTRCLQATWRA